MTQGSSGFRETKHARDVSPLNAPDRGSSPRSSISSDALTKENLRLLKDRQDATHQSDSEQSSISNFYLSRDSNSTSESDSASERSSVFERGSEQSFHERTNETEERQQLLAYAKEEFHNSVVYMKTQSELRQAKEGFKASEAYQIPQQAVKEARTQLEKSTNAYQDAQEALEQFESDHSKVPREALEEAVKQFESSDAYRLPKQSAEQYIHDFYTSTDPQRKGEYTSYLATLKELQRKTDKAEDDFYKSDKFNLLKKNLEDTEASISNGVDYQTKIKAVDETHTQLKKSTKEYRKAQKALKQAGEDFKVSEAYQAPEKAVKEARTQLRDAVNAVWKKQEALVEARKQFEESDAYKKPKQALDDANKHFEGTEDFKSFKDYKENTLQMTFHRERGMVAGGDFGTLEDLKELEMAIEEDRHEFEPYKLAEKNLKEVEDNFQTSDAYKNLEQAFDQALEKYNTYVKPPNGWKD